MKKTALIGSVLLIVLAVTRAEASPTLIHYPEDCQGQIINSRDSLRSIVKVSSLVTDKSAFTKLMSNYDLYGKMVNDKYVLCFDTKFDLNGTTVLKGLQGLDSATISGKTGKPLVIYGLTWSKTNLATGAPLLTLTGGNILLQNVTLTTNAIGVRLDGTDFGLSKTTITGTDQSKSIGIDIASGANHSIANDTQVRHFDIGVQTENTVNNIAIEGSTIESTHIALQISGISHRIGPQNFINGDQYGIFLTKTAKAVVIYGNQYDFVLPNCPLLTNNTGIALDCLIFSEAHHEAVTDTADRLLKGVVWKHLVTASDGANIIDRLTIFSEYPGEVEVLIKKENVVNNVTGFILAAQISGTLIDSATLLADLKTTIAATDLPDSTKYRYGVQVPINVEDENTKMVVVLPDGSENSALLSNLINTKDVHQPIPTTPSGGVVLIASGGDETGGGGSPIGGTEPTPSPGSDDKDDKAKDKGSQMAGGDGAAVIVGGGAAEGAPLSGLGAGVKGGCSLIIPR